MYFDRFDICEAYYALECDFNVGGILQERPSNQRRNESCGFQLSRMRFTPRPSLGSYETLTANSREIYRAACERFGLLAMHIAGVIDTCRYQDSRE
jgi:outer membrane protease